MYCECGEGTLRWSAFGAYSYYESAYCSGVVFVCKERCEVSDYSVSMNHTITGNVTLIDEEDEVIKVNLPPFFQSMNAPPICDPSSFAS